MDCMARNLSGREGMEIGTRLKIFKMADHEGVESGENIIDVEKVDEKIPLTLAEETEMLVEHDTSILTLEEQGSDAESVSESNGNANDGATGKIGKGRVHWRRGKKTKLGYRCTNYLKV